MGQTHKFEIKNGDALAFIGKAFIEQDPLELGQVIADADAITVTVISKSDLTLRFDVHVPDEPDSVSVAELKHMWDRS